MKKKIELVKKIEANTVAIADSDVLPPELMKALEDKMPEFVKEYEADGSAVLRWTHEYLILMEEILRLDFGFTEDDMVKIEQRIKDMLPILHTMKLEDTRLLRKHDFAVVRDMVERNKMLFKAEKAGIALPGKDTQRALSNKK